MTKPNSARKASATPNGVDLTAHLDEQLLVERVRAGDPLAFETIFRRYHAELCTVAEYVVGSAGAEDVVQEVFLRLWKLRSRWTVSVSVRAYLRRAVRNMALRHASRASARGHESLPPDAPKSAARGRLPLVDAGASPEAQTEATIMAEDMAKTAAGLPPRAQEVYQLSRGEGLGNREIAERLGISPKTVEIHMTRALAVLRAVAARWRKGGSSPDRD